MVPRDVENLSHACPYNKPHVSATSGKPKSRIARAQKASTRHAKPPCCLNLGTGFPTCKCSFSLSSIQLLTTGGEHSSGNQKSAIMLLKRRKAKARKTSTASAQAGEDVVSSRGGAYASSSPKYKEDHGAFDTPVVEGKDYISQLPSELLESILSYCVLDHEPEAGAKAFAEGYNYRPRSHVLLSLAAMSGHFKAHVESFCQREMMKHKDDYRFQTNDELMASNRHRQVRRSSRLQSKPVEDRRCYRFEMVRYLQLKCIRCNLYCNEFAVMANAVQCCRRCQPEILGKTIVSAPFRSRLRASLTRS